MNYIFENFEMELIQGYDGEDSQHSKPPQTPTQPQSFFGQSAQLAQQSFLPQENTPKFMKFSFIDNTPGKDNESSSNNNAQDQNENVITNGLHGISKSSSGEAEPMEIEDGNNHRDEEELFTSAILESQEISLQAERLASDVEKNIQTIQMMIEENQIHQQANDDFNSLQRTIDHLNEVHPDSNTIPPPPAFSSSLSILFHSELNPTTPPLAPIR